MPTIVKYGKPARFVLKNKRVINLESSPVLNFVSDSDFESLMNEYGSFVKPRIFNEKTNPTGCFIISNKAEVAKDMTKEIKEIKEAESQPLTADEVQKEIEKQEQAIKDEEKVEVKETVDTLVENKEVVSLVEKKNNFSKGKKKRK